MLPNKLKNSTINPVKFANHLNWGKFRCQLTGPPLKWSLPGLFSETIWLTEIYTKTSSSITVICSDRDADLVYRLLIKTLIKSVFREVGTNLHLPLTLPVQFDIIQRNNSQITERVVPFEFPAKNKTLKNCLIGRLKVHLRVMVLNILDAHRY